jgi:hypothetical protein
MTRYPSLCPETHSQEIEYLLAELHEISYVTLTFKPEERRIENIMKVVKARIDSTETSKPYRKLLQRKYEGYDPNRCNCDVDRKADLDRHAQERAALADKHGTESPITGVRVETKIFLDKIAAILDKHKESVMSAPVTWIFGSATGPTALDAHVIPFIARLLDADHEDIIPENVLKYAKRHLRDKPWLDLTEGKPTIPSLLENGIERRW